MTAEQEVTKQIREEIIKPRFDVKVALTTRGWSWEIEIKDALDLVTAETLMESARKVVLDEMNRPEFKEGA